MNNQPYLTPLWTSDQPFDDPAELASFIWLPENDGPDLELARRCIEIGRRCLVTGFQVPVEAFLRAAVQVLPSTCDWLTGLSPEELVEYVSEVTVWSQNGGDNCVC